MDRFIGLDAHVETCTLAVMGPSGRRLKEQVVETHGQALRQFLTGTPGRKHLCMEEGALSDWLYELLEPQVHQLLVVQPGKRQGSKNDARDAWARADDIRRGSAPRTVYKAPRTLRPLREAVRAYRTTRGELVRAKNQLRAAYRERGIRGLDQSIYDPDARPQWLQQLPASQRKRAEILAMRLDGAIDAHAASEQWLLEQARHTPVVRRIATAPGIGTIRAAEIVATVISPYRFRTRQQFYSYCGLAVVTVSSADWTFDARQQRLRRKRTAQPRGLNRNRHPALKNVFKGAAKSVLQMRGHPLHDDYHRLVASGTRPNLAELTIARRLAGAVLAMWKNGQEYRADKHCSHSA